MDDLLASTAAATSSFNARALAIMHRAAALSALGRAEEARAALRQVGPAAASSASFFDRQYGNQQWGPMVLMPLALLRLLFFPGGVSFSDWRGTN